MNNKTYISERRNKMENNEVMNNVEDVITNEAVAATSGHGVLEKVVIFGAGVVSHAVGQVAVRKIKAKIADVKAKKEAKKDDTVVDFTSDNEDHTVR